MTPLASTVMLLLPSRPPLCFLTWHLDTVAAAPAALHVLPRSLCSSPSTRVVRRRRRSAGSSRLPACSSRRLFLFPFLLCSSPPHIPHLPPALHRVSLFLGYFQPTARLGSPAVLCAAPKQHQQRDQAARPHGSVSGPLRVCVEPHAFCITTLCVCVCFGDFAGWQDGCEEERQAEERQGRGSGFALAEFT